MLDPSAQSKRDGDNLRGMAWMGVSVLGASGMAIAVRGASAELSSGMIVFYRASLVLTGLLLMIAFVPRFRRQLRFSRPWLHVLRGCLIGFSTHLGFYTMSIIPLAPATVLFFTAPIFATVINIFLHGERIGPRRIAAIVAGFAGAIVVLRPDTGVIEFGFLTAIGSSALFALALSLSRNLTSVDGAFSTFASSVLFTVIVSAPFAATGFQVPQTGWVWIAVAAVVVSSAVRGYADILAYHWAEAAILTPLTYMRLVFICFGAYFIFDEVPDAATLLGAAIIIGSTLYIAQRQAALRRRAARR